MWQSLKNIYHLAVAVLANLWFGFPSKKLTVIGVTGTDGKTTTVNLIYHILKTAGKQASMISSVGAIINSKNYETGFHVTTPSSWKLQKFLKSAAEVAHENFFVPQFSREKSQSIHTGIGAQKDANSKNFVSSPQQKFLILEVTSHALDQYRVWGIDFAIGVLTNITNEHLDYHKAWEQYVKVKSKLLKNAKIAIVNKDDKSYKIISNLKSQISNLKLKTKNFITYGLTGRSDINPGNFPFKTRLLGEFNRYNILAAAAAGRALGVSDEAIRKAVASFTLPIGRMEVVYNGAFMVIIDFAHTPNAFAKVLPEVKKLTNGRLIHMFGAAGKRDSSKRSLMGEASAKYADIIILTAEDPRSESVEKIIEEIELGIQNSEFRIQNKTLFKISDRQEAINTAIKMAKKGDVVLLTGKGHEQSMNYGRGEEPWSEHETVKQALKKS